jgi:predicted phage tail protein
MKNNTKVTDKQARNKPQQVTQHTKGIVIGKNWKLGADSLNIILYQREVNKKTKEERWRVYGYYATVANAVMALANQGIRDTQLANLKIVCDKIDQLHKDILKSVNTHFTDKPRNNREFLKKIGDNHGIDPLTLDFPDINDIDLALPDPTDIDLPDVGDLTKEISLFTCPKCGHKF